MAPRYAISTRRGSAHRACWPRAEEVPAQLEMDAVAYSNALVDRYNHSGHDGTHDPKVAYAFDGYVPLLFEGSNQERIETICSGNNRTLREIITNATFLGPHEDVSVKPYFSSGIVPLLATLFSIGEKSTGIKLRKIVDLLYQ
ncbi:uncharacterized protein A4U43_C08F20700 [Asparagus officinalis]|nr:uncharacterized protein A4U43_C08F20700 [Asparagus officinalis]